MSKLVIIEHDEATGVARIVLNRPEVLNALDIALAQALREAVESVADRKDVRAIILGATGRAFIAGGDVAAFGADPARAADIVDGLLDALHPAILALRQQDAPVIAAVRGFAAGAGLSLALGADLVVAEENTKFVIAYDRIGQAPDCGGTWLLQRRVGIAMANEMMLLGTVLDAAQAQKAGIVNRVVPAGECDRIAAELAIKVASGATRAFGSYKRLSDGAFGTPLAEHLEAERRAFVAGTQTADFREGVSAFLEKRNPRFSGT